MGVKIQSDNKTSTKYAFRRKAGRNIIEHRPIYSPDGESLLIIVENKVRVYNIQTSDCTRVLETEKPVNELISIQFPENEDYNLFACSDTGYVCSWTWENGVVLREIKLAVPGNMKALSFHLLQNNECFVTAANGKHLHLASYSVKTGELLYEFKEQDIILHSLNLVRVAIGRCNGELFAAIVNGSPYLFVQNLHRPHLSVRVPNSNKIRLISVAVHDHENAIATTDALGRAQVYRGDFFQHNVGTEVLHWHLLPATAVCFSLQGSYLYTGGMERVLVKWTLGNLANKVKEKMFIPRLPGQIRHIVTNNTYVAAALSNNSIIIANAQMRVVSTILECGGLSPAGRVLDTPLVYHHRLDGLLMGGRTGHLQLYSTATDKVLYNIDITGMNQIPPERFNLIPAETEITCAAVSANGSWLVTSEYRNDGITYPEERLKFWSLQVKETTPFKLNTCVNLSHGGCNVVSIALTTKGDLCVSAGADQKFRIWKRETTKTFIQKWRFKKTEVTSSWVCLTACYHSSGIAQFMSHDILNRYKNGVLPPARGEQLPYMREYGRQDDIVKRIVDIHKDYSLVKKDTVNPGLNSDENDMGGVDISFDGSLIAAWFGCKLTLWDTHLCNLRTILSHPALRPKGILVRFGHKDAAHYLVCTTENCVAVWSLLSLTVKWLVLINTTSLAADPFSNKMAITTSNNDVYIFTPHSSTPILTHKRLLDPQTGVFKECTFGASSGDDVRLYVMRNDSEIFCLEPEQTAEDKLEVISRRNLPKSNFSALLAEQQLSEVQAPTSGAIHQLNTEGLGNTAIAQFLSAAPHMVPPVSLLCTSFLQHISGHKQANESDDIHETSMDVDQLSSDEEDQDRSQLNGPFAPKAAQLWTPNYEKIKEKRLQKIVTEPLLDLHVTESIFGV